MINKSYKYRAYPDLKQMILINKTFCKKLSDSFKRKQKHLGTFETLKKAENARIEAEKKYYKSIIEEWEEKNEH